MLAKARFQALLRFSRKKERAETGRFFVEGWRWLEEALALPQPPECVLAVPGVARSAAEEALLGRARAVARSFHEVSPEELARLTENASPPGVAALIAWRPAALESLEALPTAGPSLVVALDALGDPGNAGTILRTADWFGAAAVVFGAGSVEPSNPKVVRATMGSLVHIPVIAAMALEGALERCRAGGFRAVGAALDGDDVRAFEWPARAVLVIGNEANGIRAPLLATLEHRVRIPAFGRAESLNASVAAALLVADWRRAHPPAE